MQKLGNYYCKVCSGGRVKGMESRNRDRVCKGLNTTLFPVARFLNIPQETQHFWESYSTRNITDLGWKGNRGDRTKEGCQSSGILEGENGLRELLSWNKMLTFKGRMITRVQRATQRDTEQILCKCLQKEPTGWHLDFRCMASRTVSKCFYTTHFSVICYGNGRKLIIVYVLYMWAQEPREF